MSDLNRENVANGSTAITYEEARRTAEELRTCANQMRGIFTDFENTMHQTGTEDVFFGQASEALRNRFSNLKKRFETFTRTVDLFSNMISSATSAEEATEHAIEKDADNLVG